MPIALATEAGSAPDGAGDVQWMMAGRGILHQEMPHGDIRGRFHLWANLPSSVKMTRPRYQDVVANEIPEIIDDDGTECGSSAVNSGAKRGPVDGIAPEPCYLDVAVPCGRRKPLKIGVARRAFAYIFEVSGSFGEASQPFGFGQNYNRLPATSWFVSRRGNRR